MKLENIMLSQVSYIQKDKVVMFSLSCERSNTNTSIICTCKYIQNIFPKVRLLKEMKGKEKKGRIMESE
jgi:hypothetical protein